MAKARSTMVFQEMKPEAVLKALENQPNVLRPAMKEHEQYFKYLSCYRCGGEVYAFVNPKQLFKPGSVLPNYLAKCRTCGCEFEPYSKIEVKGPDPAQGI